MEKALSVSKYKEVIKDPASSPEKVKNAEASLNAEADIARGDIASFEREQELLNNDLSGYLSKAIETEGVKKREEEIIASYFGGADTPAPAAATPAAATPATPEATPATPAPAATPAPIPTPADIEDIDGTLEEKELQRVTAIAAAEKLKDEWRERERVLRDEAYNRMTHAERLQENVRERVAQKMANAAGAVAERREQMAADEEYKAQQLASKGYFRDGDTTQYVDETERESAIDYYKARAEDIRNKTNTAGAAPRFEGDRSLTVVDIDYLHRPAGDTVGKGTGKSPTFGGTGPAQAGSFFGPDPNEMQYQTIDGRQIPIMTGKQAFETQRVGPGIFQYEKKGSIAEQLDARAARDIRLQQGNIKTLEEIDYARTGKLPARMTPKAIEEERKRRAEEENRKAGEKPLPKSPPKPADDGRGTPV